MVLSLGEPGMGGNLVVKVCRGLGSGNHYTKARVSAHLPCTNNVNMVSEKLAYYATLKSAT
jgi:hypothetical protein